MRQTETNNSPHCTDGPSIVNDKGEFWYSNGVYHCTTGPAIRRKNGTVNWIIDGRHILSNASWQKKTGMSDEDMLAMILKYGNVK